MSLVHISDNEYISADLAEALLLQPAIEPERIRKISTESSFLVRFQLLTFLTGSVLAYFSQKLMCHLLWIEPALELDNTGIFIFSLKWSFWTCILVFAGMWDFLRIAQKQHAKHNASDEGFIFATEISYVLGALLTITKVWLCSDILSVTFNEENTTPTIHVAKPSPTDVACMLLVYFLLTRVPTQCSGLYASSKTNDTHTNTIASHHVLAGLFGFVVGLSSQFLLSFILWKDITMHEPVLRNKNTFALLWSILTVFATFSMCYSLNFWAPQNMRTLLRMETSFIYCSLVGICFAWIAIDFLTGYPGKYLPSILMLLLSLVCFHVILRCFPEDACVDAEEKSAHVHGNEEMLEKSRQILIV